MAAVASLQPLLLPESEIHGGQTKKMMGRDEPVPRPELDAGTMLESEAALDEGGSPYNLG